MDTRGARRFDSWTQERPGPAGRRLGHGALASALLSASGRADPYPIYRQLRAQDPVCPFELPHGRPSWLITRYSEVASVLSDDRFVSDPTKVVERGEEPQPGAPLSRLLTTTDPPEHTRLRASIRGAFTARLDEQLRPRVREIAEELVDAVASKRRMDLVGEYAFPLPIIVIAEILGLPADDWELYRDWSRVIIDCDFGVSAESAARRCQVANDEIVEYLMARFEEKRRHPDGSLISQLLTSDLTPDELVGMVWLLLTDGYESIACAISNGVLALLRHPDQLARLRQDPACIGAAVEELLRYECPAATLSRFAVEEVEVGGRHLKKGDSVTVLLGSANRDETVFEEPDQLNVDRADNKHVAFGKGVHFCIGTALARLECQIGIGTLVRRLPALRLAVDVEELTWRPSLMLRGLESLPVEY